MKSSLDEKLDVTSQLELLDNGFHAEAGRKPNLYLFLRLEENLNLFFVICLLRIDVESEIYVNKLIKYTNLNNITYLILKVRIIT